MRSVMTILALVLAMMGLSAANVMATETMAWPYDPSPLYPFGRPNPEQTDPAARIFDPMIGINDCVHERTDYATREVSKAKAVWAWYYDMNGHGIRDMYRYGKGAPASQRIFNPETKQAGS